LTLPAPEAPTEDAYLGVERSLLGRTWRLRLRDERLGIALAQHLGECDLIGRVLAGRGVGLDDGARYLNPTLREALPDPSTLADMDRTAERVAHAVRRGEAIAVFGDYDVDGATSAALLLRYFRALGLDPQLYVPDRITEGYGPNAPALLGLRAAGASLVLTVDCGTMAHTPLAAAAEAGLDVIVLDHHLPGPDLPVTAGLVNPNRLDDTSGCGMLAAVGTAFLLCVAVNRALRCGGWFGPGRPEPDLLPLHDLVALGTVCDVVPLTGLNRALVAQGLKVAARRRNPGLAALADVTRLEAAPSAYHLGFMLGPRVNAGGRVGRADLGARLLSTDDPAEAAALAAALDTLNAERRTIEALVQEQAAVAAAREAEAGAPVIVVAGQGWHPGVIGIVASRLVERHGRPAVVIGLDGARGKGSGRSVPGCDLGAAVLAARQAGLIEAGGGHAMAAGLTVAAERVAELRAFLADRLAASAAAAPVKTTLLDGAVTPRGATVELAERIARAGPFGAGNPAPRFVMPAVRIVQPAPVGNGHVRCILAGEGGSVRAIAFRARENGLGAALLNGGAERTLHVAGCLEADIWRGETRVSFRIEDAAPAGPGGSVAPVPGFGL
jgi:single-stranded-DNA-specific exonuclease